MPQGEAKSILNIEWKENGIVGKITNPINAAEVIDLFNIIVTDTTFSARFKAFGTEVPVLMQKKDNESVTGKLMGRFPLHGSKKELFKLETHQKTGVPQTAKDTATSTVVINVSAPVGTLLRTEKYNNITGWAIPSNEDVAFYNAQGLRAKILRVWIHDEDIYHKDSGVYHSTYLKNYLSQASQLADVLLANFYFKGMLGAWADTPEQCKPTLKKIFVELKRNFPKLRYIEVMNEPDYDADYLKKVTPENYYRYYKVVYEAINEANSQLNPAVPLEVGGPAIAKFDLNWLNAFLDDYIKDKSPTKKLDFISFHAYFLKPDSNYVFLKDNPSLVKDQRAQLDAALRKRGLNINIPAFVDETGIYPGPLVDEPGSMRNDQLRQAAGMASMMYWFLESDRIYPFNWNMRHNKEGRKDQLVTRDEFGNRMKVYNKFTPYGNSMVMFSKMKKTRVSVLSSSTITKGKGLYTLASSDASGVSAMIWNFQGVSNTGYQVSVDFKNLPASFKNKNLRVRIYKIDSKTSNYHANLEKANLQLVEEKAYAPAKLYRTDLFLDPNALQLLLVEPADKK